MPYVDPAERILRRLASRGLTSGAQNPRLIDLLGGPPEEEERQSILSKIGHGLLGGLQYVGETLDKPGRALRGILGGKPEELQNLIPFSDAMGLTDPVQSVSGRDLLEKTSLLSANTPGLDWGDVAGFATEVVLDPTNLIGGPVSSLSKAGRVAAEGGELLTRSLPEMIGAIRAGETSIASVGIPGIPFISKYQPLIPIGKGEKAADMAMSAMYGAYSPIRGIRSLFSSSVQGAKTGLGQYMGNIITDNLKRAAEETGEALGGDVLKGNKGLYEGQGLFEQAADEAIFEAIRNQAKYKAMGEEATRTAVKNMREEFNRRALEKAELDPSPEKLAQMIAGGTSMPPDAVAEASHGMRSLLEGAADVKGTTSAEEMYRVFPELQRGGTSELYGLTWEQAKPTAGGMPSRSIPAHGPNINNALMGMGVPPTQLPHMTPQAKWVMAFGGAGKLQRSWSPMMDDAFHNQDAFITLFEDGKYRVHRGFDDAGPMEFSSLQEAQTAAANQLIPDPAARASTILANAKEGTPQAIQMASLQSLGKESQALLGMLQTDSPVEFMKSGFKLAQKYLPDHLSEAMREIFGKPANEAMTPENLEIMANHFATWNGGANTFGPKADVLFGSIGHMLSKVSEQVMGSVGGATPKIKANEGLKATLGNLFQPGKYLGNVDKARGAYLAIEAQHTNHLNKVMGITQERLARMQELGIDIEPLVESLGSYYPRRLDITGKSAKEFKDANRRLNNLFGWMMLSREKHLKNIPGVTGRIQKMSLDPNISGANTITDDWSKVFEKKLLEHDPDPEVATEFLQEMGVEGVALSVSRDNLMQFWEAAQDAPELIKKRITDPPVQRFGSKEPRPKPRWGIKMNPKTERLRKAVTASMKGAVASVKEGAEYLAKHHPDIPMESRESLAKFLMNIHRDDVLEAIPAFGRGVLTDIEDYMRTTDRITSAAEGVHQMLLESRKFTTAEGKNVGMKEAWKAIGLNEEAFAGFAAKHGLTGDEQVPLSMAEEMGKFMTSHIRPDPDSKVLKVWDRIRSYYSILLTAAPAKIARDAMNSTYESVVTGSLGVEAAKEVADAIRGKKPELFAEMVSQRVFGRHGGTLQQVRGVLQDFFKVGAKNPVAETAIEPLREMKEIFTGKSLSFGERAQKLFNPFKVDDEGLTDWLPSKAAANYSDVVDIITRANHYWGLRKQGHSKLAALESVKKHLFDQTELSDFEKTYARRVGTFYSWMRKNLPHQLEQLLERPGGVRAQTVRGINSLQEETTLGDDRYLPGFMDRRGAIPLWNDPEGNLTVLTGNPLGVMDLNNFTLPGSQETLGTAFQRTSEQLLSQVNPLLTWPLGELTGRQLWSGRPLKFLYGITGNRFVDNAIMHSPLSRQYTTGRRLLDPRKDAAAKAMNLLSGFSVSTLSPDDVPKWEMLDLLQAAKAVAKDNPHIKEFETVTVTPEDIQHLSPETIRLLAAYMQTSQEWQRRARAAKDAERVRVRT